MGFSGATVGTSLAMSALPNDFATPLANTVSDLNTFFILLFAVIFAEKLIVVVGTKLALTYLIPAACFFFIAETFTNKETFNNIAKKLLILGISIAVVIPASTHFTQTVCADYMSYVDETIAETDAGAEKINEIMATGDEGSSFFDKLSVAFETAIHGVSDLLTYFKNVIKKCVNSVAILLIINFALPILTLLFFKWLLKELFAIHIPVPKIQLRLPPPKDKKSNLPHKQEPLPLEDKE